MCSAILFAIMARFTTEKCDERRKETTIGKENVEISLVNTHRVNLATACIDLEINTVTTARTTLHENQLQMQSDNRNIRDSMSLREESLPRSWCDKKATQRDREAPINIFWVTSYHAYTSTYYNSNVNKIPSKAAKRSLLEDVLLKRHNR